MCCKGIKPSRGTLVKNQLETIGVARRVATTLFSYG